MPIAAWLVDELRRKWGVEQVDALLRRSMRGDVGRQQGAFYCAEVGADGVLREFGTAPSGWRAELRGGRLVQVDRHGMEIEQCS